MPGSRPLPKPVPGAPGRNDAVCCRPTAATTSGTPDGVCPTAVLHPSLGRRIVGDGWAVRVLEDGGTGWSAPPFSQPPRRMPSGQIHDRMPLLVPRENWAKWLDPGPPADDIVVPAMATGLEAYR